MKKNYLLFLTVIMSVFCATNIVAQHWITNQVIVGSGGDWANPDDFVSIASFKPDNGATTTFGSIHTQSIQKMVGMLLLIKMEI